MKLLDRLDKQGENTVILYSDTCGGQNRNSVVGSAIIHFLSRSKSIQQIEQKYFESGHSQMECDSMHSAIETTFQQQEIDLPSDYQLCMQMARPAKPYLVQEINHTDIMDFKQFNAFLAASAFSGIIKAHHITYTKTDGDPIVSMATDIDGEMNDVRFRKRGGRFSLGRQPPRAYQQPQGIDSDKKKDLLSLVAHLKSRSTAQLFYSSLRVRH